MYKAIDIARWFIYRSEQADEHPTLLKILKLLYYAEGCYEMSEEEPLFEEQLEAWEHGPVVETVWRAFPDAKNLKVSDEEMKQSLSNLDDYTKDFLEYVFRMFGKYTAWKLREMTHEEDPWLKATNYGKTLNKPIDKKLIKDFFKEKYYSDYIETIAESAEKGIGIHGIYESVEEFMESLLNA